MLSPKDDLNRLGIRAALVGHADAEAVRVRAYELAPAEHGVGHDITARLDVPVGKCAFPFRDLQAICDDRSHALWGLIQFGFMIRPRNRMLPELFS